MIKFTNPYWTNEMKISHLERRILIYSIAYYDYDESIVSDNDYEEISRQLIEMCKKHTNDFRQSELFYIFFDYDGSTGFHLSKRLIKKDRNKFYYYVEVLLRQKSK